MVEFKKRFCQKLPSEYQKIKELGPLNFDKNRDPKLQELENTSPDFLNIPLDMKVQILSYLNKKDLESVRQTCKSLRSIHTKPFLLTIDRKGN